MSHTRVHPGTETVYLTTYFHLVETTLRDYTKKLYTTIQVLLKTEPLQRYTKAKISLLNSHYTRSIYTKKGTSLGYLSFLCPEARPEVHKKAIYLYF